MQNTIVTGKLTELINDKNLIYCATINLVWNKLSEFMKGQITLDKPNTLVNFLNQKTFTSNNIDDACYLVYTDFVKNDIIDKIKKDLLQKFNETSKIDFSSLKPSDILAYAFLIKTLEFEKKFEELPNRNFSNTSVKAFGIKKVSNDTDKQLRSQVQIYSYNSEDDFIISLKTKSQDILVLAKVPPLKSLEATLYNVEKRIYQNNKSITEKLSEFIRRR